MSTDIGLDIAQSLTSIVVLYRDLEDEALHRYADKDMPGGDALNYLGPVANLEAYGYRQLSDLMGRTNAKGGEDDADVDDAPPLLVLGGWVEVLRAERGMEPETRRATITREADAIRGAIDWMLAEDEHGTPNFLPADEVAKDLRRVVTRLESILRAGHRTEFGAPCVHCRTPLTRLHDDKRGRLDEYRCTGCGREYKKEAYDFAVGTAHLAHAKELTAAQIETKSTGDLTASRVRVWGSRYPELKRGRNPEGVWLYDVEAVFARAGELTA